MMAKPRLVLCNGASAPQEHAEAAHGRVELRLASFGRDCNVNIRIEDVTDVFGETLQPRVVDLLEIAAFAYSADCAVSRGKRWTNQKSKESWGRDYLVVVPVRDPQFWQSPPITEALADVLAFLTNDEWQFLFTPLVEDRPVQEYLELQGGSWPFDEVERVVMFSGGLDSLAGVVARASEGERLVLVSHRSVSTMDSRQRKLFELLQKRYPGHLLRIPVWINKSKMDSESTQRTRSFLFGSLGIAVASVMSCREVDFFENGVVSLNLPVADEVLRSRASRTTHPETLSLLSSLAASVLDRPLAMENPFLLRTKTELVHMLVEHEAGELIGYSCSCAHSFFKTKQQAHCGTCSQCIDRRVAVLAAGAGEFDAVEDYVSDVFTGPRKHGDEQTMAVDYARHVVELKSLTPEEMARRFNLEITRAVRPMAHRRDAADALLNLHSRHGTAAYEVLEQQMRENTALLIGGALEPSSMLSMIASRIHLRSNWERYAERLVALLSQALPYAFQTEKPANEKRLQEVSDAILHGHADALVREYPFLRWSSVLTKPDWSDSEHELLVEAKYVSKREYVRRITEEVAADITKYGDSGGHVLFVIYDPFGHIVDENEFTEPFRKRSTMMARIIR